MEKESRVYFEKFRGAKFSELIFGRVRYYFLSSLNFRQKIRSWESSIQHPAPETRGGGKKRRGEEERREENRRGRKERRKEKRRRKEERKDKGIEDINRKGMRR